MASFNISENYGQTLVWSATLGSNFNTYNYTRVGITTTSFTDGATSISNIIATHNATVSATASTKDTAGSKTTPTYTDTFSITGSKTLYAFAQVGTAGGSKYYNIANNTRAFTNVTVTMSSISYDSAKFSVSYKSATKYKRFVYKKGTSGTATYLPSSSTWNSSSSAYSSTISGLEPNTTYYYNAIVSTSSTQSNSYSVNVYKSNTKSFTTSKPTRGFSLSIRSGTYNSIAVAVNSVSHSYTTYKIYYGTSSNPSTLLGEYTSSSSSTKYISNLSANTTYYVRVDVINGSTTYTGTVSSIKTMVVPSRTITASAVDGHSDQLSVTVGANSTYTTYRIGYSTGTSYTYTASSTSSSSVTRTITGLASNTTYNLVLEVDVNGGWYQTASTTAKTAMVVENVSVTGTSITSVINGFSAYSYTRTIYIQAYLAGTSTLIAENSVTIAANATTSGNITVTGLTPGTSYDIKGYIYLNGGSGSYATNPEGYTISTTASATTRFSVSAPSSGYQDDTYGTTLNISITTVDSNYRYNQVWYRINGSSSSYSKTTLTTSTTITLSNLTPGENYEINVYSSAGSASQGLPVYPSPDNSKTQYTNGQASLASSGARETSITADVKMQTSSTSRKVTIDAYRSGTKYQSCSHPVTISSGDTASGVKIDGLVPNTTYDIYCYVEYPVGSGTYKQLGGFQATTQSLQGTLSVSSNTETGVDWNVTSLRTNSGYQRIIYFDLATSSGGSNVYGNSASAASSANSASNTCWKIPPSTGSSATTLYYNCYVRFDGQTNVDGKQVQFLLTSGTYTVPYTQGTISGMSKTETSITCQLTGLSSYPAARAISIDAIPTSGTTINYSDTISANTTSKTNIQITGLKKGTSYTVYAYVKFGTTYGPSSNNWYSLGWYQVTTDGVDIDIWTWTAPNTCKAITRTGTIATQAQMTSAKNALDKVSGYTTQDFSHRVWNDLVWKISEARIAMGVSSNWNNNYGLTRDQTLMSENNSNDRILTAARYNALKNNLGENHSTGINDVTKDEPIIAQTHFYQLTNKLNEWIG